MGLGIKCSDTGDVVEHSVTLYLMSQSSLLQ